MFNKVLKELWARLTVQDSSHDTNQPMDVRPTFVMNGQYYRWWIKRDFTPQELMEIKKDGEISDDQLREWAELHYIQTKARWDQRHDKPLEPRDGSGADLYMAAIILFSFGRTDVVPDIFTTRSQVNIYCQDLDRILPSLLPLPEGLMEKYKADPYTREVVLLEWWRENESKLVWREDEGKYILNE
jgi:hypothetical protein